MTATTVGLKMSAAIVLTMQKAICVTCMEIDTELNLLMLISLWEHGEDKSMLDRKAVTIKCAEY